MSWFSKLLGASPASKMAVHDPRQFIQFKVEVITQLYAFARMCGRNPPLEELKRFVDSYFAALPPSQYADFNVDRHVNDVRTAFLDTGIGK